MSVASVAARRSGVALVLVLGVALAGACGGDDASEGQPSSPAALARVLEDRYEMEAGQASCVADQVFARLSEEEIRRLQELEDTEDLPGELQEKLRRAVTPCA